jgi:hypothetical protein
VVIGEKGQASLADAIYFLLIVSGLSTFLFFFAVNYGASVRERVGLEYRSEYAISALETLLYSSTPRVEGDTLEGSTEVDFLLAVIKEDFADNGKFDNAQDLIVNNVIGLMEPLADSFNYLYYIYLPNTKEFAFLMLYTSKWSWVTAGTGRTSVGPGESVVYLCNPASLDDLDELVTNVGRLYQANSRLQLVRLQEGTGYDTFVAQSNLTMWSATALPETESGSILDSSHLNCECHIKLSPTSPSCDPTREVCKTEWRPC